MELHLAGYGYNTARDKQKASDAGFIVHLNVEDQVKYMLAR